MRLLGQKRDARKKHEKIRLISWKYEFGKGNRLYIPDDSDANLVF